MSLLFASKLTKNFVRKGSPTVGVLKNLDLEVGEGDRIAILGKSGAGKSTLLHLLGTLERPTEGKLYIRGENVFDFKESQLSRFRNKELGFVFQFHYLMLEFTALENVMMPALLSGMSRQKAATGAENLLAKVGLATRIGHRPNQLSGGEQQRVAIARALMMNPKLLLTDEMTGNLDPVTGSEVFRLVQTLHDEFGMAMVSVTHDETLASLYPTVYRLTEGALIQEYGS